MGRIATTPQDASQDNVQDTSQDTCSNTLKGRILATYHPYVKPAEGIEDLVNEGDGIFFFGYVEGVRDEFGLGVVFGHGGAEGLVGVWAGGFVTCCWRRLGRVPTLRNDGQGTPCRILMLLHELPAHI